MVLPPPFAVLPPPVAAPEMGAVRSRVVRERDTLTFLCRSAAPRVWVEGGLSVPMSRVGDADVWAARVRIAGLDRAYFSYYFTADPRWAFPATEWRGPSAPPPPKRATVLRGRVVERTLRSAAMGEDRRVFAYLPPGQPKGPLPAFFMTDGAECERFARVLEPLVLAGRVRPCALVGADHGGYRGDLTKGYDERLNYRAREYVPGTDPARFARHRRFFAEELPAFAARAWGVSTHREDRATFGVSDGATFVLNLAADRPGFAASVVALSPYAPFGRPFPAPRPRFFLAAGSLEAPLDTYAASLHTRLPGSALATTVSGHEAGQWERAFARFAPSAFPAVGGSQ